MDDRDERLTQVGYLQKYHPLINFTRRVSDENQQKIKELVFAEKGISVEQTGQPCLLPAEEDEEDDA